MTRWESNKWRWLLAALGFALVIAWLWDGVYRGTPTRVPIAPGQELWIYTREAWTVAACRTIGRWADAWGVWARGSEWTGGRVVLALIAVEALVALGAALVRVWKEEVGDECDP